MKREKEAEARGEISGVSRSSPENKKKPAGRGTIVAAKVGDKRGTVISAKKVVVRD